MKTKYGWLEKSSQLFYLNYIDRYMARCYIKHMNKLSYDKIKEVTYVREGK